MQLNQPKLENHEVNVKIKLAALWATVMSCYIYGDYFSLYVPNKIEDFINGDNMLDSPMKLLAASLLMAIPALMICLSVILKPNLNKWLNIVFGVFYTAIMLLIAVTTLSAWWSFYVFLAVIEMIVTSLIVWYAYKWPKV
jgi:hypothetical protein